MVQSEVLKDFFAKSRAFHKRHKRPISYSTTLESLVNSNHISEYDAKKYIQTNRILAHPFARTIAKLYLEYMKAFGTKVEKQIYSNIDWNLERFIVRLFEKRTVCFFGANDTTLLRNGQTISSAAKLWDKVGTDDENPAIMMKDYLTYDEMMISSLFGVSGYTAYLNDGNRNNKGVVRFEEAEPQGIQIGLVGARFERNKRMDSIYYPDHPDYKTCFLASMFPGKTFEDRYKSRMRITIETMLMEAENRGAAVHRKTWLHVVGLGLGVWQAHDEQKRWYIEAFAQALLRMKIHHLGTLEFAWIDVDHNTRNRLEGAAALSHTKVLWTKRPPSARLADSSALLITTYAWDSNSYPGNEFFMGMLSASGDPAAAASSLISETQNPEVNDWMLKTIIYL